MKEVSIEIDEEKVYTLMSNIIEIEKKYLYDKAYQNALFYERVKEIMKYLDEEVNFDAD